MKSVLLRLANFYGHFLEFLKTQIILELFSPLLLVLVSVLEFTLNIPQLVQLELLILLVVASLLLVRQLLFICLPFLFSLHIASQLLLIHSFFSTLRCQHSNQARRKFSKVAQLFLYSLSLYKVCNFNFHLLLFKESSQKETHF